LAYRVAHVDGVKLEAHSLVGQVVAETGLVGTGAFLLFSGAVFYNCRKVRSWAKQTDEPTLHMLGGFALACEIGMLLLFYFGLIDHNFRRFNWLWIGAFAMSCRFVAETVREQIAE
jgi:O-antigen ligase